MGCPFWVLVQQVTRSRDRLPFFDGVLHGVFSNSQILWSLGFKQGAEMDFDRLPFPFSFFFGARLCWIGSVENAPPFSFPLSGLSPDVNM
jgi:hypothetical protein